MPRTPEARNVSLQVLTCWTTCCPQSLGFRLPVVATSVVTPAPAPANAATAKPVSTFAPRAAPAPPNSLLITPPEAGALQAGIEARSTGPRTRLSSLSMSRSKSLMCPTSIRRDAVLGQSTHVDLGARCGLRVEQSLEPGFGRDQAGRHGALGYLERGGDLAVGVAVVMAKDDGRGLLGRQLAQRVEEVGALGDRAGVGRRRGPPQSLDHLAHLAHPRIALERDRGVDRYPVHPGLGRGVLSPGGPASVGALEGVMRAVLGCRAVAEHADERAQDAVVRGPVEALEIRVVTGPVLPTLDPA